MVRLGKKALVLRYLILPAGNTGDKFRAVSLLRHSPEFKYTAHQFIVNVWIQKRFHSYIKEIHHLSLICSFTAEIVRQLKEIITVVNSRLHGASSTK